MKYNLIKIVSFPRQLRAQGIQKNTKTENKQKNFYKVWNWHTFGKKEGKSKFVPIHTMKTNGALVVHAHLFLILTLDKDERLTSCPGHFTARKEPQYPLNIRLGGPQSWSGNSEVHIIRQVKNHSGNIVLTTNLEDCNGSMFRTDVTTHILHSFSMQLSTRVNALVYL
jgi:hypothetical protein